MHPICGFRGIYRKDHIFKFNFSYDFGGRFRLRFSYNCYFAISVAAGRCELLGSKDTGVLFHEMLREVQVWFAVRLGVDELVA